MDIDKETKDIFSSLKNRELFEDIDKIKKVKKKDTSFFYFLTEHIFDNFFDNESLTEKEFVDVKSYVYNVLKKYIRAESWGIKDILYATDIVQLERANPVHAFHTIKYVADSALFHSGVMFNNKNNKLLRYSGKGLYYKLSRSEISKT